MDQLARNVRQVGLCSLPVDNNMGLMTDSSRQGQRSSITFLTQHILPLSAPKHAGAESAAASVGLTAAVKHQVSISPVDS